MSVQEAAKFRKAIKIYDKSKAVSESDLKTILATGALAPSFNGLEPVKVIIIKDQKLKEQAALSCFMLGNQQKVKDAPILALLLGTNGDYLTSKEFLTNRLGRIFSRETLKTNVRGMSNYLKSYPSPDMFSDEQTHLVASFMALQAADLKIGSSIMGGITPLQAASFFTEHNIVDPTKWHLSLGMLFGYYMLKEQVSLAYELLRMNLLAFFKLN
ncbi:nitroreductase family protein [Spiroplasma sp. ChiS]|uniref:nitroreductase family protein n=1 Tax=Spiroplasma sp. ChiS TaxID=2099885 RepID=UPI001F2C1D5C|nr:nitroreductase family protein [Spiroplasma sp. ChiS]